MNAIRMQKQGQRYEIRFDDTTPYADAYATAQGSYYTSVADNGLDALERQAPEIHAQLMAAVSTYDIQKVIEEAILTLEDNPDMGTYPHEFTDEIGMRVWRV
jgi:hypothetical protein